MTTNGTERTAFQQGYGAGVAAALAAARRAIQADVERLVNQVPGDPMRIRYIADVFQATLRREEGAFAEAMRAEEAAWKDSRKEAKWR